MSDQNMSEQGLAGQGVPKGHHANRGHDANRRHFGSLPNILTYARIVAVPAMVACFFIDADWGRWLAMWIFIAAGVSDFLDGYLARAWKQQSALGQMLDPIADKLIVAAALLMLAANGTIAGWSLWAGVIILSREILVSGLREFLGTLSVSVPVSNLAKWKTVVQMVAIGFLLAGPAGDKVWPYTTIASSERFNFLKVNVRRRRSSAPCARVHELEQL
ncbi:MAG: CDP-diacylglycerol--glycerol-3-phosphate 3-phosphatidyltransferase, partial [Pseudomonadota bacterium]